MVVDPGRPLTDVQPLRDLAVLQTLLRPQEEHLPLQPGQFADLVRELFRRPACFRISGGISRMVRQIRRQLHNHPFPPLPPPVLQQVRADRQQPRPEACPSPERTQPTERLDEAVLDQVVEFIVVRGALDGQEARERRGVPPHQLGRRLLVARQIPGDQVCVSHDGHRWSPHPTTR